MRRAFGLFGLVATTILLVVVGAIAYNIGWSDGVNTHLPVGAAAAPSYYYYGPHFWGAGFGIFGLLWFLFLLFLFFGFLRFLFFGRRMFRGGWGYGRGFNGPGHGYGVPPAMDEKMREWHRHAHGDAPAGEPGASTPPPPPAPPSDQRTV